MTEHIFDNMAGAKVSDDKTRIVFMGIDRAKGDDMTAYWLYDGKEFIEISKDVYEGFVNG